MAAIVVVGGGVAGLACAWKLKQAGHDVEVLERETTPGGRMRSERRGAFVLDRGAQFVASGYRNLHAMASSLGIDDRLRPIGRAHNAILCDGRLERGDYDTPQAFLRSRLLSFGAKARLSRIVFELLRRRRQLDPYHPELAAAIDAEDMTSYLRRVVGAEACEQLFVPAFSSTFDSEPEDLSGVFALLVLRFVLAGFRLESFDGGMGLLTQTLAERLAVRTGCEVTSIETEPDGASIRYRTPNAERRVLADAVVVALPGSLVAGVCPKLTPAERAFFEGVRYVRGMIAFLLLDRAPDTLPYYGVAFPRAAGLDLYGLAVDHHKLGVAPPGAGLVNVALRAAAAARLWDAPDEAVVACALENLARTPIGRLTPSDGVVHRWDPMLPQFGAGYTRRLATFLARSDRSPRLAFAGDYLIGPYTEMALTSGLRAATDAMHGLETR